MKREKHLKLNRKTCVHKHCYSCKNEIKTQSSKFVFTAFKIVLAEMPVRTRPTPMNYPTALLISLLNFDMIVSSEGAFSRGAFRGPTHPSHPNPSIPLIAFEHLSLYIQKKFNQSVAQCGSKWH